MHIPLKTLIAALAVNQVPVVLKPASPLSRRNTVSVTPPKWLAAPM
jgi:hypothetical protein